MKNRTNFIVFYRRHAKALLANTKVMKLGGHVRSAERKQHSERHLMVALRSEKL